MLVAVAPPMVIGGAWNYWFYQSMVILLISCPCALVISTPVSIVAALTSAARLGVLIKGGAFLEVAARLNAIAFDKTGVLTLGDPEVQSLVPLNGHTPQQALRYMASLEERSEHPLARAIVRHARQNGLSFEAAEEVEALPGLGARGAVDGQEFWIGSPTLMLEQNLDSPAATEQLERIESLGQTVVACGNDRTVFALLGLQDQVRPEAARALADLKSLGIGRLVMLTGDNSRAAAAAAAKVGVDGYHAELLPDEKAGKVKEEMARHGLVAMVGDGINDTQAMATASIGIALGSKSTDLALETADVVFMSDDLRLLPFLIRHSRHTVRVIKQNVAFAILTKLVFLGLALFGAATLWMAIAADMGATLVVTFNGLRLLRAQREA
jgi:Cd2+/Zn2+-exporting ATPase